jgi:hypothetical protein
MEKSQSESLNMSVEKVEETRLEDDAEAIEDRYGAAAETYAENRSEAAEMAGNEAGKAHWQKVAEVLREEE